MCQTFLPFVLSAAIATLLLAACSPERGAPVKTETDETATATADSAEPVPADRAPPSLPEPGEAGDTPVSNAPDGSDDQANFSGYGEVKFGTAVADMAKAWGGELQEMGKGENASCYFMAPAWVKNSAEFNFMIVDGKFVRFGTESARFLAPGGGKVGMTSAQIQSLYPGRIEQQPHNYTDGKYLRIMDAATGNALLFETDGTGNVTEWRVGQPPQVDYVEGCS